MKKKFVQIELEEMDNRRVELAAKKSKRSKRSWIEWLITDYFRLEAEKNKESKK